MDLDAEMQELAREARRRLEEREREERELIAEGEASDRGGERVSDPAAEVRRLAGLRAREDGGAEEAEASGPLLSWPAKLGLLLVGVIALTVLWRTVLAPFFQSALGFLLLSLIVIGAVTVALKLWGRGGDEGEA